MESAQIVVFKIIGLFTCEGGSGTNDLGNSYNVSPIGMEKAGI